VRRYKSGQCSISNSINLQEFNSATALLFTPSFLTPFVTNVKAMKGVVYSYRKTRFLEGKKEIFNVGLTERASERSHARNGSLANVADIIFFSPGTWSLSATIFSGSAFRPSATLCKISNQC
jgi:hypothetical protein